MVLKATYGCREARNFILQVIYAFFLQVERNRRQFIRIDLIECDLLGLIFLDKGVSQSSQNLNLRFTL